MLVDRGQLELDAPVQRWWPQFKARADLRQLLSHQAGVVALDEPAPTEAFYDWDRLCSLLAAQEPAWEPGTAHGESALFYGHLVGELVRRAGGRGLGRFLREEVCGPLGLDFFFGLTAAEQGIWKSTEMRQRSIRRTNCFGGRRRGDWKARRFGIRCLL